VERCGAAGRIPGYPPEPKSRARGRSRALCAKKGIRAAIARARKREATTGGSPNRGWKTSGRNGVQEMAG